MEDIDIGEDFQDYCKFQRDASSYFSKLNDDSYYLKQTYDFEKDFDCGNMQSCSGISHNYIIIDKDIMFNQC